MSMRFEQQLSQKQAQTQKLAMTQQLRQSIQMLQYNTEDLLAFLETKMLENPLMEVNIKTDDYNMPIQTSSYQPSDGDSKEWMNQLPDTNLSLFDHLIKQIHLNYRDTHLRQLVLFLVEYIDSNGYLTISLEEAMKATDTSYVEMLDALTLIQMLEPIGVGARSLQECLMLQTEKDDRAPEMAYIILEEYFEELANRKWQVIEKAYDISLYDIQHIFDYIQKLTPYPGAGFNQSHDSYINPDVVVRIEDDVIHVLSTKRGTPEVVFQQNYYEKMSQTGDPDVDKYLKERKNEFDWIKKGVEQRGDTILRVAKEIVRRQSAFFLDKRRPLVPMQLKEIGQTLDIHESTVSRSVNGKYIQTEFGVFELRSFFTTGISQKNSSEEISSLNIKNKLRGFIEDENKLKPLSDQKLADLLKQEDIAISRRTVAKYREEMELPSSSKRKRYEK